jgi:2-haloacid dehalogenase
MNMAKNAGLPWDTIMSAELSRHYKPDPEAYLKAPELFSLEPGEVMLVAAHPSDLRAAAAAGLSTGYVHRALERGAENPKTRPDPGQFDIYAEDFLDLARQLGA